MTDSQLEHSYIPIPVVVVVALNESKEIGLRASTPSDLETTTTLNVYEVPGSRPVTLVAASLLSIVTFFSSPPPTTKITCWEKGGIPLSS